MKRHACLLLLLPFLLLPACSEDDPAAPGGDLAVTFRVRDAAGDPVAGLDIALISDNDFLQDNFPPYKRGVAAVTGIMWQQPVAAWATLTIEDIEGVQVAILADETRSAGVHVEQWIGQDGDGAGQPSGRYTVRYVARDEMETVLFEDTQDMLLATFSVPVGATDADGRLRVTDRRLFPHLYERPDMQATDETGQIIGTLVLDEDMLVALIDEEGPHRTVHRVPVTAAGGTFDLVWDPPAKTASPSLAEPKSTPPTKAQDDDVPPIPFELMPPFPNPFN